MVKIKRALFLLAISSCHCGWCDDGKLTHSKSGNGTAKLHRQLSPVSKALQQINVKVLFLLQVIVVQAHQALAHQVQQGVRTFPGTPGVVATDLSRTDRAKIIAQVVMSG